MRLPRLDIVTGEVVKVQLTTETHVSGGAPHAQTAVKVHSRVINRMRFFIKRQDGKETDFSFANTTVGVREGHRVSVVLAKGPGRAPLKPILLHNHSTGQREEMREAFAEAVRQETIPSRWRAAIGAVVMFLVFWAVAAFVKPEDQHVWMALLVGALAFPVLWAGFAGWDAIVLPGRERMIADRIRGEIDGRIRPFDHIELPAGVS
jgi:hypothetical protein